ncbi:MAG TPA: TonB-dependent receptor [Vicinamibacterales bacterium]|nr:TonB-dependent receptor [Vicinamibacterales bacterium]
MRRHVLSIAILICGGAAAVHAGAAPGRVTGLVRDAAGQGLAGATVLALGETIVSARSDAQGRFLLSLTPGDYILKASRTGYVSNYREPVRVVSTTLLERTITLTRDAAGAIADDHAHTDIAWALRHLTRSVLRDTGPATPGFTKPDSAGGQRVLAGRAGDRWALPADVDFRGQLNFVTTATAGPMTGLSPFSAPRGVAYLSLGAPVAGYGAWNLHAAVASGDGSSWNVLGDYQSDADRSHLWNVRLSYSAQGSTSSTEELQAAVPLARSVASVAVSDRWHAASSVDLEYGGRAERFDYLAAPQVFGAHAAVSYRVLPRTILRVSGAQNMVAPGADEFLPPPAGGPWLPAERLFFPLTGRGTLQAERVRSADVSVAYRLGARDLWPTIEIRRFTEATHGQNATLFGVTGSDSRGQYFVGQVGDIDMRGWGAAVNGQFGAHVHGRVEYALVDSTWRNAGRARSVRRAAPSAVRDDLERVQDLTASVNAEVPRSKTQLSIVYRLSTAFSRGDGLDGTVAGGRFDVQVRQGLNYRPTRGSQVELVMSIRNLFRDLRGEASFYDELLTVRPPLRVMGGIQVRF